MTERDGDIFFTGVVVGGAFVLALLMFITWAHHFTDG